MRYPSTLKPGVLEKRGHGRDSFLHFLVDLFFPLYIAQLGPVGLLI